MQQVETPHLTGFETASHAVYHVDHVNGLIRRLPAGGIPIPTPNKRGDGEWLRYHALFPHIPTVGVNQTIVLDSLASLGPDDQGTPAEEVSQYTTRTTTAVIETWTIKD